MTEQKQKRYRESFFNLHFTSTISVALVLLVIGVIAILYLTTNNIARRNKENISLSLILNDTISDNDLHRIERYLNASPWVNRISYISRDSALQEHIEAMGDDPTSVLGYNPLNASIEVYVDAKYASVDSIDQVIKPKLAIFKGITEVAYQEDIVRMLSKNINRLSIIFSLIALVLLFISIVLINNTIRLSIYSKRFIINTMQLVGAKNSFIRRPFLKRAAINAANSAVLASALLAGFAYFIQIQIGETHLLLQPEILIPAIALIVVMSIVINLLATLAAVNRYLRMKSSRLYFV